MIRGTIIALAVLGAALIAAAAPTPGVPGGPRVGPDAAAPAGGSDDDGDDQLGSGSDAPIPEPATGLAALDRTRKTAVGFDHLVHDRNLVVSGGDSLACTTCHAIRGRGELAGRPDHRACFGTCHGAAPGRTGRAIVIDARARVCAACHAPADLVRASKTAARLTVAYPPYRIDRDHGMSMSHARHAASACTACHPASPKPAPVAGKRTATAAVHARCVGCHDGKVASPAMTACADCHVSAYGSASGPTLKPPDLRVELDHAAHARRVPRAPCTACHAAIATTDGIELPRAAATDCATAGCHDDGKAFGVTDACTRCHSAPPEAWEVFRPPLRFSHDKHTERIGTADCASCHRLDRSGDAVTIGHAACSAAGCHPDDFLARKPRICAGCHTGSEPWRKLPVDQRPLPETEHGARLPHDRHPQPCARCHVLASGDRELRPARGHVACTGTGCHLAAAGPSPRLTECTGCHELGLVEARTQLRLDARWSVRTRFRHAPHVTDPRTGGALACEACHDTVAASTGSDVPTPAKARCAPCHDGTIAFKLTGTGCARCHGKVRESATSAEGPGGPGGPSLR